MTSCALFVELWQADERAGPSCPPARDLFDPQVGSKSATAVSSCDRPAGASTARRSRRRSAPEASTPCTFPASMFRVVGWWASSKRSISAQFCRTPWCFLVFRERTNALARANEAAPERRATSLRIASLARFSVYLSIGTLTRLVGAKTPPRVACVGGADDWCYEIGGAGAPEPTSSWGAAADAMCPRGLHPLSARCSICAYSREGGPRQHGGVSRLFSPPVSRESPPPAPIDAFRRFELACFEAEAVARHALIVLLSLSIAAHDLALIEALAQALRDRGLVSPRASL